MNSSSRVISPFQAPAYWMPAGTYAAFEPIGMFQIELLANGQRYLLRVPAPAMGVAVRVGVAVDGTAVAVRVGVFVGATAVGVPVAVAVGVLVRVGVAVAATGVAVRVGVAVGAAGTAVRVDVGVGVEVGGTRVGVAVAVGGTGVRVDVAVAGTAVFVAVACAGTAVLVGAGGALFVASRHQRVFPLRQCREQCCQRSPQRSRPHLRPASASPICATTNVTAASVIRSRGMYRLICTVFPARARRIESTPREGRRYGEAKLLGSRAKSDAARRSDAAVAPAGRSYVRDSAAAN
jgi:hypothetical protein